MYDGIDEKGVAAIDALSELSYWEFGLLSASDQARLEQQVTAWYLFFHGRRPTERPCKKG